MQQPIIAINNVSKSYDKQLVLNSINLQIYDGEFLTLLGPSGCGKTTLLRLISGFEKPTSGHVFINNQCCNELPPQKRDVHTIFQSFALFPHMNVFDNIAFGLRCKKLNEKVINEQVSEVVNLMKLDGCTHKTPKLLSGGQQQRVAIARAIVNRPRVLLLDEPLSALDYRLRKSMQLYLKQLQRKLNMTFIFVTHDQEEALSMSDRIAVLHQGCIEQIGTPRQIYETPDNLTVANFIGQANVFDLIVENTIDDKIKASIESIDFYFHNSKGFKKGDKLHLIMRPEDLHLISEKKAACSPHMLPGKIIDIIYKGSTIDLKIILSSGFTLYASEFFDEDLAYEIGEAVWLHWFSGWEVLLPYES
jgi:spermidine/putrescine transport system ATP-binding protein